MKLSGIRFTEDETSRADCAAALGGRINRDTENAQLTRLLAHYLIQCPLGDRWLMRRP